MTLVQNYCGRCETDGVYKRMYVREHDHLKSFYNKPRYKWKPIGYVCLNCGGIEFDDGCIHTRECIQEES